LKCAGLANLVPLGRLQYFRPFVHSPPPHSSLFVTSFITHLSRIASRSVTNPPDHLLS
jgi:hypothetical protein